MECGECRVLNCESETVFFVAPHLVCTLRCGCGLKKEGQSDCARTKEVSFLGANNPQNQGSEERKLCKDIPAKPVISKQGRDLKIDEERSQEL